MAYSDFSIERVKKEFGLTVIEDRPLFPDPPVMEIPESLARLLERYIPLALNINTDKARSEFMVAPVLAEFKFLKLVEKEAAVDTTEYPIQKLDQIFGILRSIALA